LGSLVFGFHKEHPKANVKEEGRCSSAAEKKESLSSKNKKGSLELSSTSPTSLKSLS